MSRDFVFGKTNTTTALNSTKKTHNLTASILLWNSEGLKNTVSLMPKDTFTRNDILIITETFLTAPYELTGYHGIHSLATPTEGRPSGGVSCFVKPTVGPVTKKFTTNNSVVVKTEELIIIGVYIQPRATAEEVIEKTMEAINEAEIDDRIIIAGDFNCRIDRVGWGNLGIMG